MHYPALSPELREILRRLALRARQRDYVTVSELDQTFGPRLITGETLEDVHDYLWTEHAVRIEDVETTRR